MGHFNHAATLAIVGAASAVFAAPSAAAESTTAETITAPSGYVCLTDATSQPKQICLQATRAGTTNIRASVTQAANGSTFAVSLIAAYGTGSKCLNPGETQTYYLGYPIRAVQIGPGYRCAQSGMRQANNFSG